ncbi:MAG: hypothetical protein QGF67_10565 [Lentisphaeria bacterium]|nr:hypothetical protein [Lentisphaeria bacterium]
MSIGLCAAATAATPQFFDADVEAAVPGVHEALLLTDGQKMYFDDIYAQLRSPHGIVDEAEFRRNGLRALSGPQLQLIADIEKAIAGIRAKVEAEFAKNSNPIEHLAARQKREMIAMQMAWQLPAVLSPLQRQAVAVANRQTPGTVQTPLPEMPTADLPADDFPTGEMPADDFPTGEMPADDFPTGEMPAENAVGEMPADDFPTDEMPADDVPPTAEAPDDIRTTDSAHQPSQPAEKDSFDFLEDNIGNKTHARGFEATTGPNLLGKKARIGGFEIETSPNLLGKKARIGGFETGDLPSRFSDRKKVVKEKVPEKVSDSRNPVPDR